VPISATTLTCSSTGYDAWRSIRLVVPSLGMRGKGLRTGPWLREPQPLRPPTPPISLVFYYLPLSIIAHIHREAARKLLHNNKRQTGRQTGRQTAVREGEAAAGTYHREGERRKRRRRIAKLGFIRAHAIESLRKNLPRPCLSSREVSLNFPLFLLFVLLFVLFCLALPLIPSLPRDRASASQPAPRC
jgi:hypothetical protein